MKTPMQELIETFEEMLSPIDSKVDVDFAISLVKSMLEKEKEMMKDAWLDGRNSHSNGQDLVKQIKTFNTKE